MTNYNPMHLFDNKQPMFNTIEAKQEEYKQTLEKAESIKNELKVMWCNFLGEKNNGL